MAASLRYLQKPQESLIALMEAFDKVASSCLCAATPTIRIAVSTSAAVILPASPGAAARDWRIATSDCTKTFLVVAYLHELGKISLLEWGHRVLRDLPPCLPQFGSKTCPRLWKGLGLHG
jgi:hypothetical protein